MFPVLVPPIPILICPLLDASPKSDAVDAVDEVVNVLQSTEVRVDAPALKVPTVEIEPAPKALVMVAVLAPKAPVMVADASVDAPALKAPATVAVAEDINPVIDADARVDAPADNTPAIAIFVAVMVLPPNVIVEVVLSPITTVELVLPIRIVLAPPFPNHNSPVP
tara:strand:- start:387 stop:884 length:498 start_codon:yes stop_codon:yes gene_type:complete